MVMIQIQGEWRARLRLRLGKETCIIFDQLLKNNCRMHEKPGVTSPNPSSRSFISSGSRSMDRSVSVQDQGDRELAEATKLTTELKKFELNNTDFISAFCALRDDSKKRSYFWALCDDELRRIYVLRLIADS